MHITPSRITEDTIFLFGESNAIGNTGSKSWPQIVQQLAPLTELLKHPVSFIFIHAVACTYNLRKSHFLYFGVAINFDKFSHDLLTYKIFLTIIERKDL